MPENLTAEISHKLGETAEQKKHERWETLIEVIEVLVLAVVAVATAWTGFQATKWDGRQLVPLIAGRLLTVEADAASTYGGQLSADAGIFTAGSRLTPPATPNCKRSTNDASRPTFHRV